ncbi:hypothetical protein F0562_020036 [Nyssa sinensis]|uniref:RNA-polymerase II-associated protein 3-like C-terminal domain-containing protein n=1 Tax=Nyssa sinensis TaxID=561372 RepID=A0A5J5BUE1_9ASTE|nr:hypothetical protein F0562_020036 [Nyssa sinensis]
MARVPSKHGRDQTLDFQGFLNNLQDWELSNKDKDKKLKPQTLADQKLDLPMQRARENITSQLSSGPGVGGRQGQLKDPGTGRSRVSSSQKNGIVGEDRRPTGETAAVNYSSSARQFDYSRNYGSISNLPSGFITEESSPDAASEKELGNEYFKQKKFKEAIDCYSRSIALSPMAVAYANRAMAYLKMKRFQEAEDDCTEALNLDDRYIKAYSRRATARKELGKFKESIEDAEFALRLEPGNQEIKKQYAEAKSLYEKEILKKASGALRSSVKGVQNPGKSKVEANGHVQPIQPVSSGSQGTEVQEYCAKDRSGRAPMDTSMSGEEIESRSMRTKEQEVDGPHEGAIQSSDLECVKRNHRTGKQELTASVQELASRAASRAKAEAAKNITPPNSAYQFEVSWQRLSDDHELQAHLLKAISPVALPQIFKNALSAPILRDIVKCVATFFSEEMDLAVKYLENLAKVPRFDMIIMCLSSTDKADLLKIWDEVLCEKATPSEYSDMLDLPQQGKEMGFISRKIFPACGSMCVCCPALRSRSRQPVKRYKKLLAEIFPKSLDGLPSERKIVKLCEYAAKNPFRIPKIAKYLEERCYKELRCEHIKFINVVVEAYNKLLCLCKEQMAYFAVNLLNVVSELLDNSKQDAVRIIGCHTLTRFIYSQVDGTYTYNIENLVHKVCTLACETGEEHEKRRLRASSLQCLSAMVWFMTEFSHIFVDFDEIVHVILENYERDTHNEDDDERGEPHHNWVDEVIRCEGRGGAGVGNEISSSCMIIRQRPEKKDPSLLTREEIETPKVWAANMYPKNG